MLFNEIFIISGFILNVIILIVLITNIYNDQIIVVIVLHAQAHYSLSITQIIMLIIQNNYSNQPKTS